MNDLLYLIQSDLIEEAEQWLEKRPGFFLHQEPQTSFALLCAALRNGSFPALEMLIGHGADVNDVDRDGRILLRFAAQYSNANIDHALLLMDHGINIHHQDSFGNTALMYAVASKKMALIELLMGHGVDLDVRGELGLTALMWATKMGLLDISQKLITAGASLFLKTPQGANLLEFAQNEKQGRMVAYLAPIFLAAQEKEALDAVTKKQESLQDPLKRVRSSSEKVGKGVRSNGIKPQSLRL